ncbi:hypothetical protein HYPSUDRAFT_57204 [Hypholoma sublateritium FD-334 SS-4]|uniref:Uncharacterized protein n=1 Tax=Hypholoma sublateritium (strain FD-334 SS-4) TaxID=945553 RepID=A0A0D2PDR7_HYPSF|nr:hypothetical protein HYPSUDRAFT_57204 [Hypholoma sublateritium FD-334 SS-4]
MPRIRSNRPAVVLPAKTNKISVKSPSVYGAEDEMDEYDEDEWDEDEDETEEDAARPVVVGPGGWIRATRCSCTPRETGAAGGEGLFQTGMFGYAAMVRGAEVQRCSGRNELARLCGAAGRNKSVGASVTACSGSPPGVVRLSNRACSCPTTDEIALCGQRQPGRDRDVYAAVLQWDDVRERDRRRELQECSRASFRLLHVAFLQARWCETSSCPAAERRRAVAKKQGAGDDTEVGVVPTRLLAPFQAPAERWCLAGRDIEHSWFSTLLVRGGAALKADAAWSSLAVVVQSAVRSSQRRGDTTDGCLMRTEQSMTLQHSIVAGKPTPRALDVRDYLQLLMEQFGAVAPFLGGSRAPELQRSQAGSCLSVLLHLAMKAERRPTNARQPCSVLVVKGRLLGPDMVRVWWASPILDYKLSVTSGGARSSSRQAAGAAKRSLLMAAWQLPRCSRPAPESGFKSRLKQ